VRRVAQVPQEAIHAGIRGDARGGAPRPGPSFAFRRGRFPAAAPAALKTVDDLRACPGLDVSSPAAGSER